jgi:hypothetical protein
VALSENGRTDQPAAEAVVVSFWKSLPGILTAAGGFVASISGLLIGLSQAGLIGPKSERAQEERPQQFTEPRRRDSAPPKPVQGSQVEFKVSQASDGFVALRQRPTVGSEMLEKLSTGSHLFCGSSVPDEGRRTDRTWRPCRSNEGNDGFISTKLLLRL